MYEYKTMVSSDLPSAEQLNEQGKDGWELTQIVPSTWGSKELEPGQFALYFRRLSNGKQ